MKSLRSSYVKKPKHFQSVGRAYYVTVQLLLFTNLFFILVYFGIDKESLLQNSPWSMATVKIILAKSFLKWYRNSLHSFQSYMLKNIYETVCDFRKQLEANALRL